MQLIEITDIWSSDISNDDYARIRIGKLREMEEYTRMLEEANNNRLNTIEELERDIRVYQQNIKELQTKLEFANELERTARRELASIRNIPFDIKG